VGFATALGLANHGVRSIVLEADEGVCIGSRAICISRRSLEIIDQLGALPAFLAKGLPWSGGRSFYRNEPVLHFTMPHDDTQRLPPMINIEQFYIEQFLLDACEARADLIDIRWQSRATAIEPGADGVRLMVRTPLGQYPLRAAWLVGCDGARSSVREAAGLKLDGTSYEGRYIIADIFCPTHRPVERLAWFDPPSNPGSTILMHRQPDDVWRIDYQLRDDEDPEIAVRPENVIPRIKAHLDMIGERADWKPVWISLYRANALTADRYHQGRCLLAGDAAHLVPIFGVRGANSGFEDAHGLAWRLAFVIRGLAPASLLEDYSRERVQAARDNLRAGMKSTEFMSPPSFAFGLMRKAVLSLASQHEWIRPLINPRQTQAAAYAMDPARLSEQECGFSAGPSPGSVLIDARLTIGEGGHRRSGHLTELLGPCFTLLSFCDSLPSALCALDASLGARGIPWKLIPVFRIDAPHAGLHGIDERGEVAQRYDARPGTAYLIRPDGHVLARWHRVRASEVLDMIDRELRHE